MCRAEFSLPSITAEDAIPERKAPIRVKFEIPYFTISGIQVFWCSFFFLLFATTDGLYGRVVYGCIVFWLFFRSGI